METTHLLIETTHLLMETVHLLIETVHLLTGARVLSCSSFDRGRCTFSSNDASLRPLPWLPCTENVTRLD